MSKIQDQLGVVVQKAVHYWSSIILVSKITFVQDASVK